MGFNCSICQLPPMVAAAENAVFANALAHGFPHSTIDMGAGCGKDGLVFVDIGKALSASVAIRRQTFANHHSP